MRSHINTSGTLVTGVQLNSDHRASHVLIFAQSLKVVKVALVFRGEVILLQQQIGANLGSLNTALSSTTLICSKFVDLSSLAHCGPINHLL